MLPGVTLCLGFLEGVPRASEAQVWRSSLGRGCAFTEAHSPTAGDMYAAVGAHLRVLEAVRPLERSQVHAS